MEDKIVSKENQPFPNNVLHLRFLSLSIRIKLNLRNDKFSPEVGSPTDVSAKDDLSVVIVLSDVVDIFAITFHQSNS
jgi:hypothetical protein